MAKQTPQDKRREIIDSTMSFSGTWSKEQLEEWGVPWPPPLGWRKQLIVNGFPFVYIEDIPVKDSSPKAKKKVRRRSKKSSVTKAQKEFDRNKRLIDSGETFRGHKPATYSRTARDESAKKPWRRRSR